MKIRVFGANGKEIPNWRHVPRVPITSKDFVYRPSHMTDVRKTWAAERERQARGVVWYFERTGDWTQVIPITQRKEAK